MSRFVTSLPNQKNVDKGLLTKKTSTESDNEWEGGGAGRGEMKFRVWGHNDGGL